jgi:hypothetical protein
VVNHDVSAHAPSLNRHKEQGFLRGTPKHLIYLGSNATFKAACLPVFMDSNMGWTPDHNTARYSTLNCFLLRAVPPGLVTAVDPVVAPGGTGASMLPVLSNWNVAFTPLNVTVVVPTN